MDKFQMTAGALGCGKKFSLSWGFSIGGKYTGAAAL